MLDFEKNTDGRYYLSKSNLIADFGISKNKGLGFTGERSVSYDQYKTNVEIPDTVFSGKKLEVLEGANKRTNDFWAQNRLDSIPQQQLKIYSITFILPAIFLTIQKERRRTMAILQLLLLLKWTEV